MTDDVKTPVESAPATPETTEAVPAKAVRKRKGRRAVPHARVYINCGFNNTLVTVTDHEGNSLVQTSAGSSGFKGAKKSTPYAAQVAAESALSKAEGYGITEVDIYVKGIGPGRDQAVRGVLSRPGISVLSIQDATPIPHGGCRKKKPRRV